MLQQPYVCWYVCIGCMWALVVFPDLRLLQPSSMGPKASLVAAALLQSLNAVHSSLSGWKQASLSGWKFVCVLTSSLCAVMSTPVDAVAPVESSQRIKVGTCLLLVAVLARAWCCCPTCAQHVHMRRGPAGLQTRVRV